MSNELPSAPVEGRTLDRLVDGELADAERRQVLVRLNREPNGWRRCALAFLEAQDWSGELRRVAQASAPQAISPRPVAAPRRAWYEGWNTPLAMAASALIALGLGLSVGRDGLGIGGAKLGPQDLGVGQASISPTPQLVGDSPAASPSALEQLTVWLGDESAVQVPLLPAEKAPGPVLEPNPVAIPVDVAESLQRLGHQVQQQRRFVMLRLPDGRRVVVPIDSIRLTPAAPIQ